MKTKPTVSPPISASHLTRKPPWYLPLSYTSVLTQTGLHSYPGAVVCLFYLCRRLTYLEVDLRTSSARSPAPCCSPSYRSGTAEPSLQHRSPLSPPPSPAASPLHPSPCPRLPPWDPLSDKQLGYLPAQVRLQHSEIEPEGDVNFQCLIIYFTLLKILSVLFACFLSHRFVYTKAAIKAKLAVICFCSLFFTLSSVHFTS